jgi:predicted GNAT superfamily acetyltransferase
VSLQPRSLDEIRAAGGRNFLFRVETSDRPADYIKYERLRDAIWDFAEDSLPGSRNMMSENFVHDGSSLYIGVFAGDGRGGFPADEAHLAGFGYGFVGVRDKAVAFKDVGNLWFYSQYAGVRLEFEHYGLGAPIKEYQKKIVLEVFGIGAIVCTYDPLTGVNAQRNIGRFGMDVLEYREDTYGAFGGRLNRADLPSDRFFTFWDLRRTPSHPAYELDPLLEPGRAVIRVSERDVSGRTGTSRLEVVEGLDLDVKADLVTVRIPSDFYRMLRETDTAEEAVRRIPLDWRLGTRAAFQALFRRGYRIVDFRTTGANPRRNYYVLLRGAVYSLHNPCCSPSTSRPI